MKVFYRELVKQGKDINWLSKQIDVSVQALYAWKNGKSTPKPHHILNLSKLLKISMEDLIKDFMD